jgi:anti-anti-sigma regulatory factor
MNIQTVENKITIFGEVNTISNVQSVKEAIKAIKSPKSLIITFQDATIIPSSLLGSMLKIVQLDNIPIHIEYTNSEMGQMLESLNLRHIFTAQKI